MQARCLSPKHTRGVSLIEALIALLIVGFGLAAIAGFQLSLARHADVARQRSEATRLAQEKIETWRAGAYADIAAGNDNPALSSNTSYARSWTASGDASDRRRLVAVDVAWTDRAGATTHAVLRTIVARIDPLLAASLAVPAPGAQRRTLERSAHVPYAATRLGGVNRGKSVIAWSGASGGYLVFDDASGAVVARCSVPAGDATPIASVCTALDGYLLQGYIGGASASDGLVLAFDQLQYLAPSSVPECGIAAAIDQNNGAPIAGVLQYRCLLQSTDHDADAATPRVWSGRMRLAGLPQGSVACRYQPLPETYTLVAVPLEQQNLVVSASGTCPSGSVLQPSA